MQVIKANQFFEKTSDFKGVNIILDGLKTPENIGSIFRLAGNMGCKNVIFTEREELNKTKIEKIARNSLQFIDIQFLTYDEIENQFKNLIAIETCDTAQNIFQTPLPLEATFVVGNEKFGISERLLKLTHQQVYIPMPGFVKSLNVSHALTVGLFEWYRQHYDS